MDGLDPRETQDSAALDGRGGVVGVSSGGSRAVWRDGERGLAHPWVGIVWRFISSLGSLPALASMLRRLESSAVANSGLRCSAWWVGSKLLLLTPLLVCFNLSCSRNAAVPVPSPVINADWQLMSRPRGDNVFALTLLGTGYSAFYGCALSVAMELELKDACVVDGWVTLMQSRHVQEFDAAPSLVSGTNRVFFRSITDNSTREPLRYRLDGWEVAHAIGSDLESLELVLGRNCIRINIPGEWSRLFGVLWAQGRGN